MSSLLRFIVCLGIVLLLARPSAAQPAADPAEKYPPGLVVTAVSKRSPADQAGLKVGDVILAMDGVPLRFGSQVERLFEYAQIIGEKSLSLSYRSGSQDRITTIRLIPAPGLTVRPPLPQTATRLYEAILALPKSNAASAVIMLKDAALTSQKAGDDRAASWLWSEAFRRPSAAAAEEAATESRNAAERAGDFLGAGVSAEFYFNVMGGRALSRGSMSEADWCFTHALRIAEKRAPNSRNVAQCLGNLAIAAIRRGKLDEAESYYRHALAVREKLATEPLGVAIVLANLSAIAHNRGRFAESEAYLTRSMAILERPGSNPLSLAEGLVNLGVLAYERGRLDDAETYYRRAFAIFQMRAPNSLGFAEILEKIGDCARTRGRLGEAETYFQRALSIVNILAPGSHSVAAALGYLGALAYDRNNLANSETYFKRALAIDVMLAPDSLDIAACHNNLGRVAYTRGRLAEAEAHHFRAWGIVHTLGGQMHGDAARQEFGSATDSYATNLAQVQIALGKPDAALVTLEEGRAQAILEDLADRGVEEAKAPEPIRERYRETMHAHKIAFKEAEKTAATAAAAEQELAALREQQADEASLRGKKTALDSARKSADEKRLAEAAAREEQTSAWAVLLNAAGFDGATRPDPAAARANLPAGTLLLEFSVSESETTLFAVTRERVQVFVLPSKQTELQARVAFIRRVTARDTDERAKLVTSANVEQDALRALFQMLVPPEARDAIRKASRVVVSPSGFLWDLPFAALITNTGGTPEHLGLQKPLSYTQSLTLLGVAPSKPGCGSGVLIVGNPAYSDEARRHLLTITHTTPTRIASNRPASGLRGSGRIYNGSQVATGKSSSAAAARLLKRQSAASALRGGPPSGATGVSAQLPEVKSLATREAAARHYVALLEQRGERAVLTRDGEAPQQLPHAETEAKQVAALYHTAAHVGVEPTENWLRRRIGEAKIIHLATHGYLNPFSPQSGGVLLAVPANSPANGQYDDDGTLQAWEVWNLKLKADLVVLSACETGRGGKVEGEGLVGLTRALQYAGARTIVASQWKVSDESTAALMTAFHKRLIAGAERDEALRQAMVEIAGDKSHPWQEPYHWAAFLLVGETGRMP